MFTKPVTHAEDACRFFPKSESEVHRYAEHAITRARAALDELYALEADKRTFANTALAFDRLCGDFKDISSALAVLEMVSPDKALRDACQEEVLKLQKFSVDAFMNKKLYNAFREYADGAARHEKLNDEERYFLAEKMREFKREGFHLSDVAFNEVKQLHKELAEVELKFEENIRSDNRTLVLKEAELAGCNPHFIAHLEHDKDGNVIVPNNWPAFDEVMEHCTVESTRKQMYALFSNRAYPANCALLDDIIAKRDLLARKLGFKSYAELNIDDEMARTPERAEEFLHDLTAKCKSKLHKEIETLRSDLPMGVTLDDKGRFKPWDISFAKRSYKKKHFDVDEHELEQYFAVDRTVKGVLDIYQRFLNLEFVFVKPAWAWHDEVQLIEIRDKDTHVLRGYVFLDLYPREHKYEHFCLVDIVATTQRHEGDGALRTAPAIACIIANFPRSKGDRPALLKHHDVGTFFHEFGHAMHHVLGSTELVAFSGTSVKRDFVEVPSQLFEEWAFDKEILKNLSCHYQTGKTLPDELVDRVIALKKFDSGWFVTRQCMLSLLSLAVFKPGEKKDIDALRAQLAQETMPMVVHDSSVHMQASFGHLIGYGARYYSYMWSKVYAMDLFDTVKTQGLINPDAGKRLVCTVLAKGGSADPEKLLKDCLGREPRADAFFAYLGISI
ncbi:MAG: M3 family metallopeptidase [Candidatus Babeliales bacterium]